jgi:hypothetical protein
VALGEDREAFAGASVDDVDAQTPLELLLMAVWGLESVQDQVE